MNSNTTTVRPYFDVVGTDYRESACTIEMSGTAYRAVVVADWDAMAPDSDGGPIVLRRDARGGWSVFGNLEREHVPTMGNAEESARSLIDAWDEFTPEVWERFARIFHGADIHTFGSNVDRSGATYYAIVTADLWQSWGNTGAVPAGTAKESAAEWRAYLDGDVYGIRVDRATGRDDDGEFIWETVEDSECWGFYGIEWAESAAYDAAQSVIAADAAGILPIDFSE